ncbi:hypothetical protein D3C76_1597310 [compost metagenome]
MRAGCPASRHNMGLFSYTSTPSSRATRSSPRTSRAGCTEPPWGLNTPSRCADEPHCPARSCSAIGRHWFSPACSSSLMMGVMPPRWASLVAV